MAVSRLHVACLTLLTLALRISAQEVPVSSEGDLIKLKNGQEIVGKITGENETQVTVLFRGGEIVLPKKRIAEISRGEKKKIEAAAEAAASPRLMRFERRDEFYFVYYRGKCVGWRETTVEPAEINGAWGYLFGARTVYKSEGETAELDVKSTEFVDETLAPKRSSFSESGSGPATSLEATIDRGFVKLNTVDAEGTRSQEILFQTGTEFTMPLMRRLADTAHFPEKGETYRIFDASSKRFAKLSAVRSLRKEIVGGKHQFVTVWKLSSGGETREVWVDGWGGIVREEIGGPAMVAMRASKEKVLAFSRGEGKPESCDLSLSYESAPSGFKIERPNLTWSFDLPDDDGARALTIMNPVLQASVDVMVVDTKDIDCEAETVLIDVVRRMEKGADGLAIQYQKPEKIGAKDGVEFIATADRKGAAVKTLGAVTVAKGRAYLLLCAAPIARFDEAESTFRKVLKSFEIIDREKKSVDN